jgi:orotate phosphoribosyltransferase
VKVRLIELLKERSVKRGKFTLASGKETDIYIDVRQTTLHGEGVQLIAKLILQELKPDVVGIGGPAVGADPITGAVVLYTYMQGRTINGFMVRKEVKKYGAKNCIEGLDNFSQNDKVCVIEDTVTTGGSLLAAIKKLEAVGLTVTQSIAVVDRLEGAKEKIEAEGYTFQALVAIEELR